VKEAQVMLSVNTAEQVGTECGMFIADPNYCLSFANSDGAIVGSGDSGGPLYCKVNGKNKQFGVASFGSTTKSHERKKGFMGFVPVFGPEVNKHLGQWNPRNKPPANFPGFDAFIKSFKTARELPAYAKTAGSSSSSSSTPSSSRTGSSGSSSRINYGSRSSPSTRQASRTQQSPGYGRSSPSTRGTTQRQAQHSSGYGRSSRAFGGSSGYSKYPTGI